MSWRKAEEFLDKKTGEHCIRLHEPDTDAEHHVVIHVGHDACPHCGHVRPKNNLDELDPKALIADELDALEQSHAQAHSYAQKHSVPVLHSSGKIIPARR